MYYMPVSAGDGLRFNKGDAVNILLVILVVLAIVFIAKRI